MSKSLTYTLVNPNLLKDSSDKIRNTFGGYYNFDETDGGSQYYTYSSSAGSMRTASPTVL